MSKITSGTFSKVLEACAKVFGSMRDSLQALLKFALAQANAVNPKTKKVQGNYTYINEIIQSKLFKGLSMNAVKIYIEAHADVKLEKVGSETKFVSQRTRNYKVPALSAKAWYEFSNDGEAVIVVPLTMLSKFIKRFEGALAGTGKTTVAKADQKSGKAILTALKVTELKAA